MQFDSMEIGVTYFYTASILNWKKLLVKDELKEIIISSLQYLVSNKKIVVYGFVIMPNHIHIIWEMTEKNGKEMPSASFFKYTGHLFLQYLRETSPQILPFFEVNTSTRKHHFWQRNSLPIPIFNKKMFQQKLDYIHQNPLQTHWNLAETPENYKYSSAKFYETGIDEFNFLKDYYG